MNKERLFFLIMFLSLSFLYERTEAQQHSVIQFPKFLDHQSIITLAGDFSFYQMKYKWDEIIDLAIEQKDDNPRILIDLEATLKKLSKKIFLPEKYFRKIYDA